MSIELLNVKGYPVRFDNSPLRINRDYDFAEYSTILEEDFNPDDDWKRLLDVLIRIYRVICEHATITGITDKTIKTNLREILGWISELRLTYKPDGVTALDLNKIFESF